MSDNKKANNKDWPLIIDDAITYIDWAMKNPGVLPGLSTGLKILDKAIDGIQPSHLVTVGAGTGCGKTSLLLNIAYNTSSLVPVGFISLEQPASELAFRVIAECSGKSLTELKRGELTPEEFQSLQDLSRQIKRRNLIIRDNFDRQFDMLKQQISSLHDNYNIQAAFLDYVQLAQGADTRTRDREIGVITGGLKALAVDLNIPIVIASQINREARHNPGKRPTLSNLRESGSIEMDSDVVLLLHREYYHLQQDPKPSIFDVEDHKEYQKKLAECHGKADLIVAKNRHGPSGKVLQLAFDEKTMKFSDRAINDGGLR